MLVWFRVLRNSAHTFNASLHCLPRPLPRLSPLPQSLPIRTIPRPALILGSLAKGSWLAARLAFIKYVHTLRHLQRPNCSHFICRQDRRIVTTNIFIPTITAKATYTTQFSVGCGAVCACMVSRPAKLCAHTLNASLHCLPRPLPRLSPPVQ